MKPELLNPNESWLASIASGCRYSNYVFRDSDVSLDGKQERVSAEILNRHVKERYNHKNQLLEDVKDNYKRLGKLGIIFYFFWIVLGCFVTEMPSVFSIVMFVLCTIAYGNSYVLMHSVFHDFYRVMDRKVKCNLQQITFFVIGFPFCFISFFYAIHIMENEIDKISEKERSREFESRRFIWNEIKMNKEDNSIFNAAYPRN